MILFPNITVLTIYVVLISLDTFLKKLASRRVIENLPVLFTTRVISFVISLATFLVFIIIQACLPEGLASSLIGIQPTWQTLTFILIVSAREPALLENVRHYLEAILLSTAIPILTTILTTQTDLENDLAIMIAQAVLSVLMLIVIFRKYTVRLIPALFVMWTFGIGLTTYFTSTTYAYYGWTFVPLALYWIYAQEVKVIRAKYHTDKNYIDFSIICGGVLNGHRVSLEESTPSSMTSYRSSYVLSSIGFAIDSPSCFMINELQTLDMQDFLRLLSREKRSKDWNMSLMYLMDCAKAVHQVHTNHPGSEMFLDLGSFVFCKDTIKLRYELGTHVISSLYKSPISGNQSNDLYALGVICWQIMHPTHHFNVKWKTNSDDIYFSNVVCANVKSVISKLLSHNPNQRPSAAEVYSSFTNLLKHNLGTFIDLVKLDYTISGKKILQELSIYANKLECLRLCNLMVSWSVIESVNHIDEYNFDFFQDGIYVTGEDYRNTFSLPKVIPKTIQDENEDEVNSIEL